MLTGPSVSALTRLLFPTLGRPKRVTKPDFITRPLTSKHLLRPFVPLLFDSSPFPIPISVQPNTRSRGTFLNDQVLRLYPNRNKEPVYSAPAIFPADEI